MNNPYQQSIAFGSQQMYVLQSDHTVVSVTYAQPSVLLPMPYTNVRAVAAGTDFVCVASRDGTIAAELIGNPYHQFGLEHTPADAQDITALYADYWTAYACAADGTLYGWGRNGADLVNEMGWQADTRSIHACRDHLLVLTNDGYVLHTGSAMGNDADTYPLVRQGIKRLHAADIRAIAITTDHRVIDLYDARIGTIAQDENIVDVVATRSLYGLLYANGRVVVLNRYACMVDDDPLYVDPVILAGVSGIIANGDVLTCVGFDGRLWAVRSDEQFGHNPQPVSFPDSLRVKVWPGLSTQPEDYDADACHEANTIALQLGAIKQNHTYMNAPKLPVF